MQSFVFDIFGLKDEAETASNNELPDKLMSVILDIRNSAKTEKNFILSDKIRDSLKSINIQIKDGKDCSTWEELKG